LLLYFSTENITPAKRFLIFSALIAFFFFLGKSGKKLGEMGYLKISPNEYINKINSISE